MTWQDQLALFLGSLDPGCLGSVPAWLVTPGEGREAVSPVPCHESTGFSEPR